jgi:hypothetical protein
MVPVQEQAIGQQLADAKKRQGELRLEAQAQRKHIRKLGQQKGKQLKCAKMCSKEELLIILRGKEAAEAVDGDLAAAAAVPNGDLAAAAAVPDGDLAAAAAVPDGDLAEAVLDGDLAEAR